MTAKLGGNNITSQPLKNSHSRAIPPDEAMLLLTLMRAWRRIIRDHSLFNRAFANLLTQ